MADVFEFYSGVRPLLVSFPHDGTALPAELAARMTPEGRSVPDTDFHVAQLYDFVASLGASRLVARYSRYVVDLNRDPEGASLYPGADTTGLCPTSTFARQPIYATGQEPTDEEVGVRVRQYFWPYHEQLAVELERLHRRFGRVVLFDAHSIRSQVPRFFEGTLPDLNLGTASGASADATLAGDIFNTLLQNADGYSAVRDERFRGGYITRKYGAPDRGVSAIQLELAQKNYMREQSPFEFMDQRAARLRPTLRRVLEMCVQWAEAGHDDASL